MVNNALVVMINNVNVSVPEDTMKDRMEDTMKDTMGGLVLLQLLYTTTNEI